MTNQERAGPTPPAHGPEQSDEFRLNRAYRCFAFLGIVMLPFPLLDLLTQFEAANGIVERWSGLAELVGMILALPIFVGMLCATIYGIRQTVRFRHPALVVLSMVSIVCGIGLIVLLPYTPGWNGGPDLAIVDYGMGVAFGIFIAANLIIPAWCRGVRGPPSASSVLD